MGLTEIRDFVESLTEKSYLPKDFFQIDDLILQTSIEDFKGDYTRWYPEDHRINITRLWITPQLIALLCYRIAHRINSLNTNTSTWGNPDAYSLLGREIGQIELFYSAEIGHSFKINHGVGSVIGARCRIGDNCTIHQNCTIGDRNGGRPTIGDNVVIYAGAMILGNIYIGDNCIIGANSVVTKDCPANSVIVGSPGRIIGIK